MFIIFSPSQITFFNQTQVLIPYTVIFKLSYFVDQNSLERYEF